MIFYMVYNVDLMPTQRQITTYNYPTYAKTGRPPAHERKIVNAKQCFTEVLKNTNHTFVFIITASQWEIWKADEKDYGWGRVPEF
jgi:hypothetical protein